MINFQKFLDWSFWFSLRPSPLGERATKFLLVGFCIFLLIALGFKIFVFLRKKNPLLVKLLVKMYKLFLTMGLVGLALLFLSYEQVYFLGSHFWYLIWLIGFLVWLIFILRYLIVKMPKEKRAYEEKKRLEKYLPR